MLQIFSCDAREARSIISQLSYLSVVRTAFQIEEELQARSRMIVNQKWQAICAIADALLVSDWEPVRPLAIGSTWSNEQLARYLDGNEVVAFLAQFGINAEVTDQC